MSVQAAWNSASSGSASFAGNPVNARSVSWAGGSPAVGDDTRERRERDNAG